jgi:excisionase family DNA binding protein
MKNGTLEGGIDTREAGQYLGLAKSTMERLRIEGGGPAYAKYGGAVRYYRKDLDAFRESRMFRSTSEYCATG